MADPAVPRPGRDGRTLSRTTVIHLDLTVPDAGPVMAFYATVVGWTPEPLHGDWIMNAPDCTPAAAICHARGEYADLPPQWPAYVEVADLTAAAAAVSGAGGAVVAGPKGEGPGTYVVVRDPPVRCRRSCRPPPDGPAGSHDRRLGTRSGAGHTRPFPYDDHDPGLSGGSDDDRRLGTGSGAGHARLFRYDDHRRWTAGGSDDDRRSGTGNRAGGA